MNKKHLFLLPLAFVVGAAITSCVPTGGVNEGGYNTVTITFDATDGGYYTDETSAREEVVVKEARYGISWSKLIEGIEKPADPSSSKVGYHFSFYKIGNTEISDSYKLTSDIVVTAVYETDGNRFCYDPWDIVIQHANQGLNNLKQHYANDPDYINNGNSFIGLERDLKYGNSNYKVRVIGENSDDLVTGENKVTALTFEFSELLPGYAYDSKDSSHYETSSLRNSLNGRIKNNFEDVVKANLQQVKKYTNEGDGTPGREHIITTEDYVFVPSMYELGILNDENGDTTEREGYTYGYYAQHTGSLDRKKSYRSRSGQLVESNYWTRSPDTTVPDAVWPIDNSGHTGIENAGVYNTVDPSLALGISPCFGIGVSTISPDERVRFETDSWANIINTANRGYNALKERYKIDMSEYNDTFVGLTHSLTVTTKAKGEKTYTVRVIGENHDHYIDNGRNYTAPLTFQFTSVLGQEEDMYVSEFVNTGSTKTTFDLEKEDNWHYYNSMVERCLESYQVKSGTMDTTWSSVAGDDTSTLLTMLDPDVQGAVRPVQKTSWSANFINTVETETMGYKLFPLSYSEYGAYQQNLDTYGEKFSNLIKDDGEKPYEYYDYHLVDDKETKEEKFKEIESRRVFNDVTEEYETHTKSGITTNRPVLDKYKDGRSKWAHSYLRSINMVNFGRYPLSLDYYQPYAMLHPNGEANDWSGMPMAESLNQYCGQTDHKNYRIGIVPAFAIGRDLA